jgi:hypothetical protein
MQTSFLAILPSFLPVFDVRDTLLLEDVTLLSYGDGGCSFFHNNRYFTRDGNTKI